MNTSKTFYLAAGLLFLAAVTTTAFADESLTITVGDPVSFTIEAISPTENVDNTPLDDLVELRLYSCEGADCAPTNFRDTYPATEPGGQVFMPRSFQPDQVAGDVRILRYAATAVDAGGNESELSNVKTYTLTFVEPDLPPKAPALMMN